MVMNSSEVKASSTQGKATAINLVSADSGGTSATIMNTKLVRADSTDGIAIKAVSASGDNTVSLMGDTTIQGER